MIDTIDREIITALRINGLASNIDLAKKFSVYTSTVAKRIERLLDNQIIAIQAIPNPFKLGYKANAFVTLDVDILKVKNICDTLSTFPNITTVATCFGRYDIYLMVSYPDWELLNRFVKEELPRIDGIQRVDTILISEILKRYQGIFNDKSYENIPITLSEIDRRLLEELMKDGRARYADLASKLDVSMSTVSRRIASLLKENIIRIIAIPNPSKLGFRANANILLTVEPEKSNSISRQLANFQSIYMVLNFMDGYSILAGVNFPYPEMLYEFLVEKVAKIEGVKDIETVFRAQIIKATYAHLDLEGLGDSVSGSIKS